MIKVKVGAIKSNTKNPRIIKNEKFLKLVKSIKDFPEMESVRPIVVNKDMIILGGNMRYKAMIECGYKEVNVEVVDWSEQKQNEFIIKDNVGFGEWEWEMVANEWDSEQLEEWGLDSWKIDKNTSLDDFFNEENKSEDLKNSFKIILDYNESDYNLVNDALNELQGSKEQVIFKLLNL